MRRVWILLLLAAISPLVLPQGSAVSEAALKSALFFKLPQFVYQPDDSREQALQLCLLGAGGFDAAFEKLARAPIDGRVVRFTRLSAPAEAGKCHFIFVTQSEHQQLGAILRVMASLPVVTVSEINGFAKAGGMVELALGAPGAPVSILINRQAARQKNIEFNAQLLRLAKVVEP